MRRTLLKIISPFRWIVRVSITLGILLSSMGITPAQAEGARPVPPKSRATAPKFAPAASVSVSAPAEVPLGENVSFSVTFDNTGTDTGYGPFIDIALDRTGADGIYPGNPSPANTYDGLSTNNSIAVTYNGNAILASDIYTVGFGVTGNASHPLMVDSGGNPVIVNAADYGAAPGDKLLVIRLPFGSFTPAQPPATVDVTVNMSNLADVDAPLSIWARGGFQFGDTPLNDYCCGDVASDTLGAVTSSTVTPQLLVLSKSNNAPEGETATGPNFPRTYSITADLPSGQTITGLTITDTLPDTIQYISSTSVQAEDSGTYPSTSTPGGTLTLDYTSVSADVTVDVDFYVPLNDASSNPVLDPVSGDDVAADNSVTATADWLPVDTRDRDTNSPFTISVNGECPSCPDTITHKSIAIQKSVSGTPAPDNILTYTLEMQISDFFAFGSIGITDVISDGQRFDTSFIPTMQVLGNPTEEVAASNMGSNYQLVCFYTGAVVGPGCDSINAPIAPTGPLYEDDGFYGTTRIFFDISAELIARGYGGNLLGGCVDPSGGLVSPCDSFGDGDGPTSVTITFQTIVQDEFSDAYTPTPPYSGDESVDQGDILTNDVTVIGDVLDYDDSFNVVGTEDDDSSTSITLPTGEMEKTIYAINGDTSFSSPVRVKPLDEITFRIKYEMPTSDEENLELTDFLPLPVFFVDDADADDSPTHTDGDPVWSFDNSAPDATSPASGVAKFGPDDTFFAYSAITPGVTADAAENSLTFTYGDFDDPADTPTVVDILFTLTVSTDPFADGLYLTNQAHGYEGSTNGGLVQADSIVQFIITEPILTNTKSVFWTDSVSGQFSSPVGGSGVTILSPSDASSPPRWDGTINSNYLDNHPIDADISQVDADDILTFAIVIENSGTSLKGAFDIQLQDTLNPLYDIPSVSTPLNLQIYYGNGTGPIPFTGLADGSDCTNTWPGDPCGPDGVEDTEDDIFGYGIELIDPATPAPGDCTFAPGDPCGEDGVAGTDDDPGVCQAHDPNLGNNVILITYDLQISSSVAPGDIVNTATILNYSGDEGGPNHLEPEPLDDSVRTTDTATATVDAVPVKYLVNSSEAHTTGTDATIGEILRYRVVMSVPESTTTNLQMRDLLPDGLTFLNDGTALIGFVSNGGVSSTDTGTLPIPGINSACFTAGSTADATTPATLPCILADDNIGSTSETDQDVDNTYTSGDDVYFKLGDIVNTENDSNTEYVVVEFNALVHNETTHQNDNGDVRNNRVRATTTASNTQVGSDSSALAVTIREPILTLTKSVTDEHPAPGQVVTFTLVIENTGSATAFEVDITDGIPAQLALALASVDAQSTGVVTSLTNSSTPSLVHFTAATMEPGAIVTITYDTTVNAPLNDIFVNDAETIWTSLPGDQGTTGNPTGTDTPGLSGADNGERNSSGGQNDYSDTDEVTLNVDRQLAKNLVSSNLSSTAFPDFVTIGEILTYELVLTVPAGTTDTAIITDTLSDGLAFVDCAEPGGATDNHDIIAGPDITSSNFTFAADGHGHNVASCNHGITPVTNNPVISNDGQTVVFDLGTIENTDQTTPETITITYRAIVLDSVANVNGVTLNNEVEMTWGSGNTISRQTPSVEIIEPDMEIEKTVDPVAAMFGSTVTFGIEISHTDESLTTAYDVVVFDEIPTGLVLNEASVLVETTDGGLGLPVGQVITTTPTSLTVRWDEFPLEATATITFTATFVGPAPVFNSANVEWSSLQIDPAPRFVPQSGYNADSTERRYDPLATAGPNDYGASSTARLDWRARLPRTGFAPNQFTSLPDQPVDFSYAALGSLWIEIPRLGVKTDIVGVPLDERDWNLTWLGNQAGYLEGSAYPTHAGNSAITAHAYLADGTPGPFVALDKLRYGEQIIIHLDGQQYIYEVRENALLRPTDVASALRHEKYPWLTLITCKSYNEATGDYTYRSVVHAVLVKILDE